MNQQLVDKLLHKAGARFGAEGTDYSGFSSSKFAELIVRECAGIANKNRTAMEMDRNTQLTATAIKQHFGVGE